MLLIALGDNLMYDLGIHLLAHHDLPKLAHTLALASLPADDLDLPGRQFFRFTSASGDTIGYGGFELYGSDVLIRSIVVFPEHRESGLGRALVAQLMEQARAAGARDAYLLTTTARPFFEAIGFSAIERTIAPAAILGTAQVTNVCPASAQMLFRTMPSTAVTIFHNPACGTSRNVLGLIRNSGEDPHIVEYLKTPPTRDDLISLIGRMGISVRDLLRRKGTPYDELGLDDLARSDDALVDAMVARPILINRPIVITPLGVKLCRPSEAVLDILPNPQRGAFSKEDGEAVVDTGGRCIERPAP